MKKTKSIVSWLLALLLILGTIQIGNVGYSADGNNISDKVEYSGLNFYTQRGGEKKAVVKDGKLVANPAPVEVGYTVIMEYGWKIPSGKMTGIKANDYFEFELPTSGFIKGLENQSFEIKDGDVVMGTYTISTVNGKQILKAVLNETAASKPYLENGWFVIQGTVEKEGDLSLSTGSGAPIVINIKRTVFPYGWGIWDSKFTKEASYDGAKGEITWSILTHFENLKSLTNENTFKKYEENVLVDYLPQGVDLTQSYVRISYYTPSIAHQRIVNGQPVDYEAGKLTWKATGSVDLPIKNEEWVNSNPSEELEAFISRIQKGAITDGKFKLGLFNNGANKIAVIGLGNSPSDFWTYEQVLKQAEGHKTNTLEKYFASKIDQNSPDTTTEKHISQAMYDKLLTMYGNSSATGGKVLAFNVVLKAKVTEGNGEYANRVELRWKDQIEPMKTHIVINYASTAGGVGGGKTISVYATKVWADGTTPTDSVTVRLFADDVDTGKTLVLNAPLWSANFRGLPDKKDDKPIVYTVKEDQIPGFISTVSKDTDADKNKNGNLAFLITNENDLNAKIQIDVKKVWPANEVPPVNEIVAKIMNGTEEIETLKLTSPTWEAKSKELPKFDANSVAINYTVKEVPVDGYEATYGGNLVTGLVITNTKKPAAPVVKFNITKKWDGVAENEYKDLEVKVNVYAKGKDSPANAQPIILNYANQWKAEIELPKLDTVNNEDFVYTVKEVPVAGFKSVVTGDMASGFVVTNTKEAQQPQPSIPATTTTSESTVAPTTTQKDNAPDYFPPTTTTPVGTADIDEDDPARGGVTTTTAAQGVTTTQASPQSSDSDVAGTGDKLPHTGNLPNELFYTIGAFVAVLGVLVLSLQKLKK